MSVVTNHQYEPPKLPPEWTGDEKKFYTRLIDILDEIYSKYGRLSLTDLSPAVRKVISGMVDGTTFETAVEQLQDSIALKASQSTVDELGQQVSSNTAAITLVPGQITSAVTAIQVGGRNLITDSETIYLEASTSHFAHKALYSPLTNGQQYTITFGSVVQTAGSAPAYLTLNGFCPADNADFRAANVQISNERKSYTFAVPDDGSAYTLILYHGVAGSAVAGNAFTLSEVKLEIGNKATDWTPAPEDTDAAITATRSMITQTASEIRAEVSDISIGGTNLLPGTRDWSGAVISRATQDGTYQDCDVMHYNFTASGSPSYSDSIRFNGLDFDSGGTYMISFWCKGSGSFTLQTATAYMVGTRTSSQGVTGGGNFGEITINVPTDWTRIWVKWQINSGTWTDKSILFRQITNASNLYVAGVKLERGDKATDWSESEDELINSSVTINDSGIYMSTKGTLQIDADDPAKKGRIALGELMSLDYTGGLQAKDGSFANSLKVNGKQVMTAAEITAPIKVATSQPSGHGFLWVKPTSVTSASYSAYSAGSRDSTVHFGATNPISRSFTADTTATLANATFTYTLDFDVYCLTDLAQITNVKFTAVATKGSASVSFGASAAMTMTKYTLAHITLTASSSTNLCTNSNAISVAITASASSLTKLFIQSDQYMTLKISNQAGTGTQTCSVYYVN